MSLGPTKERYAFDYHSYLMTDAERAEYRRRTQEISDYYLRRRAQARRAPTFRQRLGFERRLSEADLTTASGLSVEAAENELRAFCENVGARFLREHPEKVVLNLCPRCGEAARTPRARQCPACYFDWHDRTLPAEEMPAVLTEASGQLEAFLRQLAVEFAVPEAKE